MDLNQSAGIALQRALLDMAIKDIQIAELQTERQIMRATLSGIYDDLYRRGKVTAASRVKLYDCLDWTKEERE